VAASLAIISTRDTDIAIERHGEQHAFPRVSQEGDETHSDGYNENKPNWYSDYE
jgi:hypothetical protein